jgi:hypothetical protein
MYSLWLSVYLEGRVFAPLTLNPGFVLAGGGLGGEIFEHVFELHHLDFEGHGLPGGDLGLEIDPSKNNAGGCGLGGTSVWRVLSLLLSCATWTSRDMAPKSRSGAAAAAAALGTNAVRMPECPGRPWSPFSASTAPC